MKIVDVTTTRLFYPHTRPTQNSTSLAPVGGRGQLFVHLKTDEGVEGLGVGMSAPGVDRIVENGFGDLLVGRKTLSTPRGCGETCSGAADSSAAPASRRTRSPPWTSPSGT